MASIAVYGRRQDCLHQTLQFLPSTIIPLCFFGNKIERRNEGNFTGYLSENMGKPGETTRYRIDAGDPRLDTTIKFSDKTIRKYVTRDKFTQTNIASTNNPRLLRYADVLLLKSEATLQSGGSTADAIALLNQVRTRARTMATAGTSPANYSAAETDKTKIMGWIMNERFTELAAEGQRWFDLRRWQMQGLITLNNSFFNSNVAMAFDVTKHLYMPIPNSELDVNPNMKQNPGH